jgi:ankyrin repeat protein
MLGHVSIVGLLLQHGDDIEYQGREGRSPLVLATQKNHLPVAQLLVANGADLLSCDMCGGTPISYALSNGYNELLDLFLKELQRDRHSEEYVKRGLQILLSQAALDGDLERIQYALSNGADVNHQDPTDRKTPLCLAAAIANASTVKLLLESGANPNVVIFPNPERSKRRDPITPLISAVQNEKDSEPIVRLLLDHGADARIHGGIALYHAARLGRVTIFRLLVDHGAPLDYRISHVFTLMSVSIQYGQQSMVELLLEKGMQPSEEDWDLAKRYANPDILKLLEGSTCVQRS